MRTGSALVERPDAEEVSGEKAMSKILYDNATKKWFRNHIGHETTVCKCEKCGLEEKMTELIREGE